MENVIERKLKTYTVEIFECNSKFVDVEATTAEEARNIVEEKYYSGEITPVGFKDYPGLEFRVE